MQVGVVLLPDLPWPVARDRWREAESIGFATAWTYDHLSWRTLRDGPWLGTMPLLSAVAAVTERLRIGPLVTSPNFRHPAVLAKDVMTLDRISGGRVELGVGAGGTGYDATVLGDPPPTPPQRAARFAEFVDCLDVLLCEPKASYAGEWFTAIDSRTEPGCVQQPRVPFTVAATGPRGLAVVAQHAERWVTFGPVAGDASPAEWYDAVGRQASLLDAACTRIGRDGTTVRRAALVGLDTGWAQDSIGAWDDFCGRVAAVGFDEVIVHWPRPADPTLPGVPPLVFDEIAARLC